MPQETGWAGRYDIITKTTQGAISKKPIIGGNRYIDGRRKRPSFRTTRTIVEGIMLIELLRRRRSIRKFTDQPVEKEKLDILVEAMLRSPSSRGLNPWQFVLVTDGETIRKLASSKAHGSSFVAGAPLAVVICADPEKSDVWVEDASIASLIVHLQATDLGLGSCWVQIRNRDHDGQTRAEDYVRDTLDLDRSLAVEAIVAIGYEGESKQGRTADTLLYERISYLS